ncbi:MAG: photosystem II complex extrinsic protein PsbU [Leptolyngbyaceae bacterium]|nr:photosystem II complex extrinsic protein PsbU [Leptolyngbyaceae bacterium]
MKRLAGVLAVLVVMMSVLSWLGAPRPAHAANFSDVTLGSSSILAVERRNAVEEKLQNRFGTIIDVNNSNVRAFVEFPGMYPTLAGMIVRNGPYSSVEDVFKIPGLTERQKQILDRYRDRLVATPPTDAMVEGGDRFNNGFYE